MNYILNIHTTADNAVVNICDEHKLVDTKINRFSKEHASFLHIAIHQILQENDILPFQLKAIGATGGPGSYTGIRIGLSTAKGLCFSLKIPLMIFNTLELMAYSAIENIRAEQSLYCPMIDARRMEVFTAIYDSQLNAVKPPSAIVLEENSFADVNRGKPIYFFGNGAEKFKKLIPEKPSDFYFPEENITSEALAKFSNIKFEKQQFANLILSEAIYVKEFFTPAKKI